MKLVCHPLELKDSRILLAAHITVLNNVIFLHNFIKVTFKCRKLPHRTKLLITTNIQHYALAQYVANHASQHNCINVFIKCRRHTLSAGFHVRQPTTALIGTHCAGKWVHVQECVKVCILKFTKCLFDMQHATQALHWQQQFAHEHTKRPKSNN